MAIPWLVVKIGGSILESGSLPALLKDVVALSPRPLAIVPGGGPFADAVRVAQAKVGFSDALAHRLALAAMGQMAAVFAAAEPVLRVVGEPDDFPTALAEGRVPVWDPAALSAGHPAIAESWAVTSDSLAVFLAAAIGAERATILKSSDVPRGLSCAALAARGIVDEALPEFARRFNGKVEVRGPRHWPGRGAMRSAAA